MNKNIKEILNKRILVQHKYDTCVREARIKECSPDEEFIRMCIVDEGHSKTSWHRKDDWVVCSVLYESTEIFNLTIDDISP